MVRHTVLMVEREAAVAVSRQLPDLFDLFDDLGAPLDVIVVDDGSSTDSFAFLEEHLLVCPSLRIIRLEQPHGIGYALSAGIAAARGDVVVVVEAGEQYPASQIPKLLEGLAHADMVCGRRPSADDKNLWRRASNVCRWALPASPVDDPGCLFWAARREAVAGLDLSGGMAGYIASMVAARGFRVDQVPITTGDAEPADRTDPLSQLRRARRRQATSATNSSEAVSPPTPIQLEVPPGRDEAVLSPPSRETV